MANITQEIQKRPLTAEEMAEWAASPEGRAAIRARESKDKLPHTPKEIEKFTRMAESYESTFIRVDSKTKQPMEEAKEFFWRIISFTPSISGSLGSSADVEYLEGNMRINFLIQKYYRDPKLMYETRVDTSNPNSAVRKVHAAYCGRRKDGSLLEPGDRLIDASDFMEQFQREKVEE